MDNLLYNNQLSF